MKLNDIETQQTVYFRILKNALVRDTLRNHAVCYTSSTFLISNFGLDSIDHGFNLAIYLAIVLQIVAENYECELLTPVSTGV